MAKNQHAKPAGRLPAWRFWLHAVVWGGVLAATVWTARALQHHVLADPRFVMAGVPAGGQDAPDFVIEGAVHTSRDRVLEVFGDDFGKNIFRIPIAERRRRLLAIDWVAGASVSRLWPNRLIVRIQERTPVAFVKLAADPLRPKAARPALIDGEGVILQQPEKGQFSFPVLIGVSEKQPEAERKARVARMQQVLRDIASLPRPPRLSEVDVSSRDIRVSAEVDDQEVELILGDRDFASRVQTFLAHYPEIHKRTPQFTIFDLRLSKSIIARDTERSE
jgi:cell division protein FtsQ